VPSESAALSKTASFSVERTVLRQTHEGEGPATKILRANSEDIHIGENTSFEGSFETQGTIFIDGQLTKARIQASQLSIGPRGRLEGDVAVARAEISGAFSGRMTVGRELVLRSSARVEGEISCAELVTHRGATLRAQVASLNATSEAASAKTQTPSVLPRSYRMRRRAELIGVWALGAFVAGGMMGIFLLLRLMPMVVP
jgi:cytoskeletal protein CcmA (bactofilin family)